VTRSFHVNGRRESVEASPLKSLLRVLREDCGLTDVRQGCERGSCGACLVFVDGNLASSCLVPFHALEDARVETLDGLRGKRDFQELERALDDAGSFRCGFCANGVLLAAYSLLRDDRSPNAEAVRDALSGNLCRCGSHAGIVEIVVRLSETRRSRRRG
jgi:aerobic carbon-monoxide dehydrogenase small subunit